MNFYRLTGRFFFTERGFPTGCQSSFRHIIEAESDTAARQAALNWLADKKDADNLHFVRIDEPEKTTTVILPAVRLG